MCKTDILLTAAEMRALEKRYMSDNGIDDAVLVERAAKAMTDCICSVIPPLPENRIVFACGSGGNGADGYEAARLYARLGGSSIVVDACSGKTMSPVCAAMRERALSSKGVFLAPDLHMPRPSAWVDAMFGIGFRGELEDMPLDIARRIEQDRLSGSTVIACDIPSGLDADTGSACSYCVRADHTVTFEYAKHGHFLLDGLDMCGKVTVRSIGIDTKVSADTYLYDRHEISRLIPGRKRNTHKGNYGHLLIIAGSRGMAGACAMSTLAALRSGTGLVTVACPESIVPVIQTLAPCAMCIPLPESDGAISGNAINILRDALKGKSAIAIGPGLSRRCAPEIIALVLMAKQPAVIDADALNIISEHDELKALLTGRHMITPHPGEAARLIPLTGDPVLNSRRLASLGVCAIYKGASSVISYKDRSVISTSGSAGMAKGGSGDVLTGICGALLARGIDPFDAAAAASELHGLAGEIAAKRFGEESMLATDMISCLGEVFAGV